MDGIGEPISKPGEEEEGEASLASDVDAKGELVEGARCAQCMSKSPPTIVDEGEERRFAWLVGGESSRRSLVVFFH